MQIRKGVIEDINEILALYREQFYTMRDLQPYFFQEGEQSKAFIQNLIEANESDILILIKENKIEGFALLQEKETPDFPFFVKHKCAYIMDIVVTNPSRGKGFGSNLIEQAEKWALARKLEYIELDVLSNNENAIQFY